MPDTLPLTPPARRGSLRVVSNAAVGDALARSRVTPRLRANLNVHQELGDPIQRLFNVLQPGSYIRPHRHEPSRWELFVVLSGRAGVMTFDEAGTRLEHAILEPGVAWAVEIAGGAWHTAVALETDTILFEVKSGPYRRLEDKDYAPWAPPEGDPRAPAALAQWEQALTQSDRTTRNG
jgi:cupin fold WbuC family metalloprotein